MQSIYDSIEEVHCNVAVKLSINIKVHALIESCDIEVKLFPNLITA